MSLYDKLSIILKTIKVFNRMIIQVLRPIRIITVCLSTFFLYDESHEEGVHKNVITRHMGEGG